jgi:hypothetical protein
MAGRKKKESPLQQDQEVLNELHPDVSTIATQPEQEDIAMSNVDQSTTNPVQKCVEVISTNLMPPKDLSAIGNTIFNEIFGSDAQCLNNWKGKIAKALVDKAAEWKQSWSLLMAALSITDGDTTSKQLRQLYRVAAFRALEKTTREKSAEWKLTDTEILEKIKTGGHSKVESLIKAHHGITVAPKTKPTKTSALGDTCSLLEKMITTMRDQKIKDRLSTGRLYKSASEAEKRNMKTALASLETELRTWSENIAAYKNAIS